MHKQCGWSVQGKLCYRASLETENNNIMADVATVSFSGSSAEDIEKAKAFWKCINLPPEQKSTLAVSGINHRLKTAPQIGEGSLKHCF